MKNSILFKAKELDINIKNIEEQLRKLPTKNLGFCRGYFIIENAESGRNFIKFPIEDLDKIVREIREKLESKLIELKQEFEEL